MYLVFFVEEPSVEEALRLLVPKIMGQDITFQIIRFNGKQDMLRKLPDRLRAYAAWIPDDWYLVVLVDEDREDCRQLKTQLEDAAQQAGFVTRSMNQERFRLVNRIAIEELEAWYLGDVPALVTAYPKLPSSLGEKRRFRDPDAVPGGTWEALEQALQEQGYHAGGLEKLRLAREVVPHMTPHQNRSHSFQVFHAALEALKTFT